MDFETDERHHKNQKYGIEVVSNKRTGNKAVYCILDDKDRLVYWSRDPKLTRTIISKLESGVLSAHEIWKECL